MIIYIIWNLIVFLLYGLDKLKAKRGARRIPERVLLGCAFLMGGAGAGIGMLTFRHKTQKVKFTVLVPLAIGLNAAVIYFILRYVGQVDIFAAVFGDIFLSSR
ncbi:MAG: DUF1294 domain-containing protein [Clostridia bacterium]